MPLTDADAHDVLDSRFGGGAGAPTTAPASWWVALSTTTPALDGTGVTEPAPGAGYAPVEVINDAAHWPDAAGREKTNASDVVFPQATSGWGTVTHYVLKDGAAGTVRAFGALSPAKVVTAGAVPRLEAGQILIAVPGA